MTASQYARGLRLLDREELTDELRYLESCRRQTLERIESLPAGERYRLVLREFASRGRDIYPQRSARARSGCCW